MNGDLGKIYTKVSEVHEDVAVLKQTEKLHHEENRKDLDILFEGFRKIENLPCQSHIEKLLSYKVVLCVLFVCISSMAWWMFTLHT